MFPGGGANRAKCCQDVKSDGNQNESIGFTSGCSLLPGGELFRLRDWSEGRSEQEVKERRESLGNSLKKDICEVEDRGR